jgi:predicted aldo/keto reductase-like oxidoreductase
MTGKDAHLTLEHPMRFLVKVAKYIQMDKAALDRISLAQKKNLCVACMKPVGNGRVIRGCHEACWKATKRAVAAGKFTEEERIAEGKILECLPGGRAPSNPVSVEAAKS